MSQPQQQQLAAEEEPLRRTDANEVAFQETTPARKKYSTAGSPIPSTPTPTPTPAVHVDRPFSVSSETGYGGASGAGKDVSAVVEAEKRQQRSTFGSESGSVTHAVKDFAHGVKDSMTGQKQEEAAQPVVNQNTPPREGLKDKMKDAVTGQRPGHGCSTQNDYSGEWPSAGNAIPSATYTDEKGRPIEGPRDDPVKKEGVMSKVMDKFNLGTNKE